MPNHGPQPLRAVLTKNRYTVRQAAAAINVDPLHLTNVIRGGARPCQAVRDRLPELLGVPLEELFTEDALLLPYMGDLGLGNGATRSKPVAW